jgi:hypothetical protein
VTSGGTDWASKIGTADDIEGVPGPTFIQAQDEARKRAKVGHAYDASTVGGAIDAYEIALKERGDAPANIKRLRYHLPPCHDLLRKIVGLLTTAGPLRLPHLAPRQDGNGDKYRQAIAGECPDQDRRGNA